MTDPSGSETFQKLMTVAKTAGRAGPKHRVGNPYKFTDELFMKYLDKGDEHTHETVDQVVHAIGDVRPQFKGRTFTNDEVWTAILASAADQGVSGAFNEGHRMAFDAIVNDVMAGDYYKSSED